VDPDTVWFNCVSIDPYPEKRTKRKGRRKLSGKVICNICTPNMYNMSGWKYKNFKHNTRLYSWVMENMRSKKIKSKRNNIHRFQHFWNKCRHIVSTRLCRAYGGLILIDWLIKLRMVHEEEHVCENNPNTRRTITGKCEEQVSITLKREPCDKQRIHRQIHRLAEWIKLKPTLFPLWFFSIICPVRTNEIKNKIKTDKKFFLWCLITPLVK